jgi:hypothetical protein
MKSGHCEESFLPSGGTGELRQIGGVTCVHGLIDMVSSFDPETT